VKRGREVAYLAVTPKCCCGRTKANAETARSNEKWRSGWVVAVVRWSKSPTVCVRGLPDGTGAAPTFAVDGEGEARLVSIACSEPPAGHARWTLRLLGDRLVELKVVESIFPETMRQVLKKRHQTLAEADVVHSRACECGLRAPDGNAVYQRAFDPAYPVVRIDETSEQCAREARDPIPAKPGQSECYDVEYERNGVARLLAFYAPFENWRRIDIADNHTAEQWTQGVRQLVQEDYPQATRITLVLGRQCLDRRLPDLATVASEVQAWTETRNQSNQPVDWRFTTEDARIKLKRLYPILSARASPFFAQPEVRSVRFRVQTMGRRPLPSAACVHPGAHSARHQDSRNDLTPCRMAWHFVSAGAHAPHSDQTLNPMPTQGSSHSARRLRSPASLSSSTVSISPAEPGDFPLLLKLFCHPWHLDSGVPAGMTV